MPKNETGEFELVLGNRQLLSGFAVVAILFGVFFAMGYIVGRNSTPSARLSAETQQPSAAQPEPAHAPNPPPAPPPPTRGGAPTRPPPAAGTPRQPPARRAGAPGAAGPAEKPLAAPAT